MIWNWTEYGHTYEEISHHRKLTSKKSIGKRNSQKTHGTAWGAGEIHKVGVRISRSCTASLTNMEEWKDEHKLGYKKKVLWSDKRLILTFFSYMQNAMGEK